MDRHTKEHFEAPLTDVDPETAEAIDQEYRQERERISLIASENFASRAVCQALGGVLTNKTTEGYPGARFLCGSAVADRIERLAAERARTLFGCAFANVQPHSGSQMNQAVLLALVDPGETILSMHTACGGHLSHGARSNLSGRLYQVVRYGVDRDTRLIDHDEVARLAHEHRPRLLTAGGSSYPRRIEFQRFREIADEIDAALLVDMSHFAGLVAGGVYPDPLAAAHVVTSTTYKSLRGPRGGVIFTDDADLARRIDAAVTPGLQDSPGLTGDVASDRLERAGILANRNQIPFDERGPRVTSGIRLGTNAGTSRGFGQAEFRRVADLVADVLDARVESPGENAGTSRTVRAEVETLCRRFPFYAA